MAGTLLWFEVSVKTESAGRREGPDWSQPSATPTLEDLPFPDVAPKIMEVYTTVYSAARISLLAALCWDSELCRLLSRQLAYLC
jgi:hypothetical protein